MARNGRVSPRQHVEAQLLARNASSASQQCIDQAGQALYDPMDEGMHEMGRTLVIYEHTFALCRGTL